jgi:PAS domain S-box-containing protein
LAAHALNAAPAWVWSADASCILWANATAAAIFRAPSPAALAALAIDPNSTAPLQVARIAGTLPPSGAPRLERLRGFSSGFGRPLMCACSRIVLHDRTQAILVLAMEPAGPKLALDERVRRTFADSDEAAAIFTAEGALMHATGAAQARLAECKTLAALGAETLASDAIAMGEAHGGSPAGDIAITRVGADAATVLMVTFPPAAGAEPAPAVEPQPADDQPPSDTMFVPPPLEFPAAVETADQQPPDAPQQATPPPATEREIAPEAEAAPPSEPTPEPAHAAPTPPPAAPAAPADRRRLLRFVWQMDTDGRFSFDSDEFASIVGPHTAAALAEPWSDASAKLGLDPQGHIAQALQSRDTWSGITVAFPVDGTDERLPIELSALPVFDRDRTFRGYRGFGVCRDVAHFDRLMQSRQDSEGAALPHAPQTPAAEPPVLREEPPVLREERPALSLVPPTENVLPFRTAATPAEKSSSLTAASLASSNPDASNLTSPGLTPVERKAFRELASRLTARLRNDGESDAPDAALPPPEPLEPAFEPSALMPDAPAAAGKPEPFAAAGEQRAILDRLPVGVLVYRLDRLIYANRAFLDWTGYEHLDALTDAGGLDALFVEPKADAPPESGNGGKTLSIATNKGATLPVDARLFSTHWDGESALVLMLANGGSATPPAAAPPSALQELQGEARELRAIIDIATDGIVVLDHEGRMISVNRSAEALFGYESRELAGLPFAGIFAPESQRFAFDALDAFNRPGPAKPVYEGREVVGRARQGGTVPLFMTLGRVSEDADKLCAVFRDIRPWKQAEQELVGAKRQAEQASSAKSDFLAKISHEIRTPLNAIIGFSEVMIEERFGAIGNDRYKQYLKDIHTSGGHLVSLLNDLLDLSKIEAGKLELTFATVDLNELTQQCVALMQPQANRERIIIRLSLSSTLPAVVADARSVRQIVLNLLSNSIKFTGAGGQVIVSTALTDDGEVVLRVRDTGVGMSEKDIAIALEPFRQLATSARWGSSGTGLGLPLTKALAEANRATFNIKSAVNAGTLIEVAFSRPRIAAE